MVKYPDVIVVVVSLHFDDRYAPAAVDGQDVCCQLIEKHIFTEINCHFDALELHVFSLVSGLHHHSCCH